MNLPEARYDSTLECACWRATIKSMRQEGMGMLHALVLVSDEPERSFLKFLANAWFDAGYQDMEAPWGEEFDETKHE